MERGLEAGNLRWSNLKSLRRSKSGGGGWGGVEVLVIKSEVHKKGVTLFFSLINDDFLNE